MLQKLQNHLATNFSFLENKKLLLATSGGLDSMVLLDLFRKSNYEIAIAHCNFQLRGLESFEDQKFVQDYAKKNNFNIFVSHFDTESFAKDYKLSTQVAARNLRYDWFYELLENQNFDYILTAHHADDNLETFIINLSRSTGLSGLLGIPVINDKIIRPLLIFSRQEISEYATQNDLKWREDSSNASDKYLRNKIRHQLIPLLKEINPNFLESFQKTQNHLLESQNMVEDASIMIYQQVAKEFEQDIHFDLKKLKQLSNYKSYLFVWLNEFGFSAWEDIYNLVEAQSGKQIFSSEYKLLKNRDFLILTPLNFVNQSDEYWIEKDQKDVKIPINISFCKVDDICNVPNTTIFVDENKLQFPLKIRKWQNSDFFQPFGMNGKSKKISKFFKDEKLSLIQKEKIWILLSDNQVVWVMGLRQDERFIAQKITQNKLQISIS